MGQQASTQKLPSQTAQQAVQQTAQAKQMADETGKVDNAAWAKALKEHEEKLHGIAHHKEIHKLIQEQEVSKEMTEPQKETTEPQKETFGIPTKPGDLLYALVLLILLALAIVNRKQIASAIKRTYFALVK